MPWRESVEPVRMQRVALVAPTHSARDMLCRVADDGTVQVERVLDQATPGPAGLRLQRSQSIHASARLSATPPDLEALASAGRFDLLAGEADLEAVQSGAVSRGSVCAFAGWMPREAMPALADRLAEVGAAVVPLPPPPSQDPPTALRKGGAGGGFAPVVSTYATVPYADVDPTIPSAIAYVVMFGMMFADAGQGLMLALAGLLLRSNRLLRLASIHDAWPFLVAAGLSSTFFGVLYGEFFGPTGVITAVWLDPLEEPITLLIVAIGVGALLLAGAYLLGTINRWREGGWRHALYASTGIAGSALFLGLGLLVSGWYLAESWLVWIGVLAAVSGLALTYAGLLSAQHGAAGVVQASIELFDNVLRLGSNVVSFARLAAFGLVHAALGLVVWEGTTALWSRGGLAVLAAAAVFLLGNALTFTLEVVVAAVQALRLEYYELFSRVFELEGRPFEPWHVPLEDAEDCR